MPSTVSVSPCLLVYSRRVEQRDAHRQLVDHLATDAGLQLDVVVFLVLQLREAAVPRAGIGVVDDAEVEGRLAEHRLDAGIEVDLARTADLPAVRTVAEVDPRAPHASVEDAVGEVDAALHGRVFAGLREAAEHVVGGRPDVPGEFQFPSVAGRRRRILDAAFAGSQACRRRKCPMLATATPAAKAAIPNTVLQDRAAFMSFPSLRPPRNRRIGFQ